MISFGAASPLDASGSSPRVVVEALVHRSELASVEFQEAREHAIRTAIAVWFSAAFLLLFGFTATVAVAASVWHREDRGLILSLLALGYLVVAAVLSWVSVRRIKQWEPFSETRRQFHEDCACVQEIISSAKR
jgi:uncharacterized membrane protein YqjE